jgi:hypothetical protein
MVADTTFPACGSIYLLPLSVIGFIYDRSFSTGATNGNLPGEGKCPQDSVNVRYMVEDVEAAVEFHTTHFSFALGTNAAPAFADVVRGNLHLLLSGASISAGRPMPEGWPWCV